MARVTAATPAQTPEPITIPDDLSHVAALLTLPEHEQNCLDLLVSQGYTLEDYQTATGKTRAIIRGYRTTVGYLRANPWNPNEQTIRQSEALGESIGEFGQILEIIVRPHPDEPGAFQIIDGEHRFNNLSAKTSVNVLFGLSDAEAKKLTIILNETRGEANKIKLAELLANIHLDMGDDTQIGLPYEASELAEIIKLADVDWDNFETSDDDFSGSDDKDPTQDEWVHIHVRIPKEAMDVINQAYALISDQRMLHKDKEIAWGQVIEALSAEYLAIP